MRDIVATIQPEQDEIVRAELGETICVQGGPGTGKTAVGLHRAAYLLYAHANQLRRGGVLVVGPNEAFIRYIGEVLPALGEIDVEQKPLQEVIATAPAGRLDDEPAARIKHDARMVEVIRRAIESRRGSVDAPLAVRVGVTTLCIPARDLALIRARALRRKLPDEAGRRMFRELVVGRMLEQAEQSMPSVVRQEVAKAMRESKAARDLLSAAWPKLDPAVVIGGLLSDERTLWTAADGVLSEEEQRSILRGERSTRARPVWSAADLVLIDEAAGAIVRPRTYGHVIVDEAQDLSPMQLRAIGRRCDRSATLLGDLAQATTPWASTNWEQALHHLGVQRARVETLSRAFRIPGSVLALSNRLLRQIAPSLAAPVAVRDAPDALTSVQVTPEEVADEVAGHAAAARERPGSIGVIVARDRLDAVATSLAARGVRWSGVDEMARGERVTLLVGEEAKGLEFDVVVLAEPARIMAMHPKGLRLVYIAMTRAVSRLVMVQTSQLLEILAS